MVFVAHKPVYLFRTYSRSVMASCLQLGT